jgi:biotin operon repressor
MDNLIVGDFDAFMETVSIALAGHQAVSEMNIELKEELETTRRSIEVLKLHLEQKGAQVEELKQDHHRISQELTQISYDSGKAVQMADLTSRLKYELDMANTAVAISRRELAALRTENERLRLGRASASHRRPVPSSTTDGRQLVTSSMHTSKT